MDEDTPFHVQPGMKLYRNQNRHAREMLFNVICGEVISITSVHDGFVESHHDGIMGDMSIPLFLITARWFIPD